MVFEKHSIEEVRKLKKFSLEGNVLVGKPVAKKETSSIAKLILDSLTDYPDTIAVVHANTGDKLTFSELKDRSIRCALWLKKFGIKNNDIVCTSTPNQVNDCVPYLATLYLGAISCPWFHELTHASARHFFDIIQPSVMFACEQSIGILAKVAKEVGVKCKFIVFGKHSDYQSLNDIMAEQSREEIDAFQHFEPADPKNDVAMILFSSGTTGIQKGTMLSYYNLAVNTTLQMMLDERLNHLWYSTLSWITGSFFAINSIRTRCTRIIHDHFEADETSKVVEKYKVNWTFLTPSMVTELCKSNVFNRYDYSSIQTFYSGGSRISKTLLEQCRQALPQASVCNTYGMTEAGGLLVKPSKNCKRIDSLGYIVDGLKMKVVDVTTGRSLGPNQEGELYFKTDTVMLGYYKNPAETKKMVDSEGWLHTGDLGYYDEDGEIYVVDRLKAVIICQNYHISPSQIEDILLRHPGVKDVAVVAVPHEVDVERPLAFVVRADGAKVSAEELMELPASYDEHFRLTGGIVFVDKLPYTSTGKKGLKQLKEMAKAYAQ